MTLANQQGIEQLPHRSNKPSRVALSAGFSLIEVVICVGLVATVLLALIALLAISSDNSREAVSRLVSSQIASQMVGELQLSRWDDLKNLAPSALEDRYFDEFGDEIDVAPGATSPAEANFTGRLLIRNQDTERPDLGTDILARPNDHLIQVRVIVVAAPADAGSRILDDHIALLEDSNPDNLGRDSRVFVYQTAIANTEKAL